MSYSSLNDRLNRIARMVDGWNNAQEVSPIERDILLAELRALYTEVLDTECSHPASIAPLPTEEPASAPVVEQLPTPAEESAVEALFDIAAPNVTTTSHDDVGDAFDDALDIDALLGLSGDDPISDNPTEETVEEVAEETAEQSAEETAEEVLEESVDEPVEESVDESAAEEPEAVAESAAEPEAVTAPESVTESEAATDNKQIGGLFDIDDIPVKSKSGRRMISIYDTPIRSAEESQEVVRTTPSTQEESVAAPAPKPQPKPQPKPVEAEQPQRLGDVIAKDVTTLADKMAEEQPTAAFNRIQSIRSAIGLNDKFLLIRDLFDGDAALYEDTISHLDEYNDLDECMIFIVENFQWNPDSEGAKMLVSLIERKLA